MLIAKAVSDSDQEMAAESHRVRIGQAAFPAWRGGCPGGREQGKGEIACGISGGEGAEPEELSVLPREDSNGFTRHSGQRI